MARPAHSRPPPEGLSLRCGIPEPARFRNELRNGEVFYSLRKDQILIEKRRHHDNTVRPHSALAWQPPAPEAIVPMNPRPNMH